MTFASNPAPRYPHLIPHQVFFLVLERGHPGDFFEVPVKIRHIIKATFETNHLGGQPVLYQGSANMRDSDLYQKLGKGLMGHPFEIATERGHTHIGERGHFFQSNVFSIVGQNIGKNPL